MLSRVTQQIVTTQIIMQIQRHTSKLYRQYKNISSGVHITRPSDNISKYNLITYYKMQNKYMSSLLENINNVSNTLDYIVVSLQDINAILTRASQISSIAIDTTLDTSTYRALSEEVDIMIRNVLNIFNRKLYDTYLFAGESLTIPPFVISSYDSYGRIAGISYSASPGDSNVKIVNELTIPLYYSGSKIEGNNGLGIFQTLIDLRNALSTYAPQRMQLLDTIMFNLESLREHLAGFIGSISSHLSNLRSLTERYDKFLNMHQSMLSDLESTDYINAIVEMNESQYLLQASMAITARYFSYSFLDYIV